MVDVSKVSQLNAQYDNKTVKIEDNKGQVHEVKLSIFQEGMAVTNDTKDVTAVFNANKDARLNAEEVAALKKVIYENAGEDQKLDDNEILKAFNLDQNSPNAKEVLEQFKNMVERQATGSLSTTVTNKDGSKRTESFNADGSGSVIEEIVGESPVKITANYSKGKVLEKQEKVTDENTTICEYTNNDRGNPVAVKTSVIDDSGNVISTTDTKYTYDENGKKLSKESVTTNSKGETQTTKEQYTYNEQGLLVKTEGEVIKPTKIKSPNGNVVKSTEKYTIELEYHPNGNLAKKVKTCGRVGTHGSVSTAYFNEEGKITRQEIKKDQLRIITDKDGKFALKKDTITQTVDYKYNSEGKKSEVISKSVDIAGYPSETVSKYSPDGKTIVHMDKTYYKHGAKIEEKYDGVNIENRAGLPSEKVEFEKDGTTVKQKTINHFDKDGILVSRDVYDKAGNKIKAYDFSKVDGNFEVSNQIGCGDCYLLAAINSLAMNEDGHKLLQQNVKVSKDDKGKDVYTVSLPGASEVRENLKKKGVAEDKISIRDSYTVTEDELRAAAQKAGKKYSAGDKDVLLLEVVYEKYRKDVAKTKKANKKNIAIQGMFGLGTNTEQMSKGDYLSGGKPEEAVYVLTGKKPARYVNPNAKNCPVCYVDDNLQLHLTDPHGNIVDNYDVDFAQTSNAKLDTILDQLEKDCADGKLDNYAATVGIKVTSQEVNGQAIKGGGHAFTITKVDKENVYLSNPWSPDTPIVMSRADFAKVAMTVSMTPVNQEGVDEMKNVASKPIENNNEDNVEENQNSQKHKPNYTVPKGKRYNDMIKEALISQGIAATRENIQKAKEQFEAQNPKAVHRMRKRTRKGRRRTISYLYANDKVYIPQFKI